LIVYCLIYGVRMLKMPRTNSMVNRKIIGVKSTPLIIRNGNIFRIGFNMESVMLRILIKIGFLIYGNHDKTTPIRTINSTSPNMELTNPTKEETI